MRVLTWDQDVLYASRGYELLRCRPACGRVVWEPVGSFSPAWWRKITAFSKLSSRLVRDGFHGLVVLPTGELIAAVPGAIATLKPGGDKFQITHTMQRGTRPLNIVATPDGRIFWGEYFNNPDREQVHVYGSKDRGMTWQIAYSFPKNSIRHIHNIIYDRWGNLAFYANDITKPWDGSVNGSTDIAQQDVYVYKVTVKDNLNNVNSYIGNVTIVK